MLSRMPYGLIRCRHWQSSTAVIRQRDRWSLSTLPSTPSQPTWRLLLMLDIIILNRYVTGTRCPRFSLLASLSLFLWPLYCGIHLQWQRHLCNSIFQHFHLVILGRLFHAQFYTGLRLAMLCGWEDNYGSAVTLAMCHRPFTVYTTAIQWHYYSRVTSSVYVIIGDLFSYSACHCQVVYAVCSWGIVYEMLLIFHACIMIVMVIHRCLQCFDTVGWVAGRASGL